MQQQFQQPIQHQQPLEHSAPRSVKRSPVRKSAYPVRKSSYPIQKSQLPAATSKLSPDQALELRNTFSAMDSNFDGVVTREELAYLLRNLSQFVTDEQIDDMI